MKGRMRVRDSTWAGPALGRRKGGRGERRERRLVRLL